MTCESNDELLAQYAAGETEAGERQKLVRHLARCEACSERVAALQQVDRALRTLRPRLPGAGVLRSVRQAIAQETRRAVQNEIMTLDEVAAYLRIPTADLEEFVEDLPAFEVAGQVRVRREQLTEWVGEREGEYARKTTASWLSGAKATRLSEGVA